MTASYATAFLYFHMRLLVSHHTACFRAALTCVACHQFAAISERRSRDSDRGDLPCVRSIEPPSPLPLPVRNFEVSGALGVVGSGMRGRCARRAWRGMKVPWKP